MFLSKTPIKIWSQDALWVDLMLWELSVASIQQLNPTACRRNRDRCSLMMESQIDISFYVPIISKQRAQCETVTQLHGVEARPSRGNIWLVSSASVLSGYHGIETHARDEKLDNWMHKNVWMVIKMEELWMMWTFILWWVTAEDGPNVVIVGEDLDCFREGLI